MKKLSAIVAALLVVTLGTSAWGFYTYPSNKHIFLKTENTARYHDDETTYNYPAAADYEAGYVNKAYYGKFDGGGLNALHITNTLSNRLGQNTTINTTTGSASGTFYITDTGGKGYDDDIILLVSVKPDASGNIPSTLSLNVTATGPVFPQGQPASAVTTTQPTVTMGPGNFHFNKLGYKPAPGTGFTVPLYYNYTTQEYQGYIDLKVGQVGSTQDVTVNYSVSGMTTHMTFNAYAWMKTSNQGQGVSWTNDTASSGYAINKQ